MRSRRKALAAELDDVRAQLAEAKERGDRQAARLTHANRSRDELRKFLDQRNAELDTARTSARETMELNAELQAEGLDLAKKATRAQDYADALIAAGDRLARCAPKNGAGPGAVGNWRRTVAGETTTETTTEVEA